MKKSTPTRSLQSILVTLAALAMACGDGDGDVTHCDPEAQSGCAPGLVRVTGGGSVTYSWTGATLQNGMIYQFQAVSFDDTNEGREHMSGTEDLRGVFVYDSGAE